MPQSSSACKAIGVIVVFVVAGALVGTADTSGSDSGSTWSSTLSGIVTNSSSSLRRHQSSSMVVACSWRGLEERETCTLVRVSCVVKLLAWSRANSQVHVALMRADSHDAANRSSAILSLSLASVHACAPIFPLAHCCSQLLDPHLFTIARVAIVSTRTRCSRRADGRRHAW